jgi:hypothetical protein
MTSKSLSVLILCVFSILVFTFKNANGQPLTEKKVIINEESIFHKPNAKVSVKSLAGATGSLTIYSFASSATNYAFVETLMMGICLDVPTWYSRQSQKWSTETSL